MSIDAFLDIVANHRIKNDRTYVEVFCAMANQYFVDVHFDDLDQEYKDMIQARLDRGHYHEWFARSIRQFMHAPSPQYSTDLCSLATFIQMCKTPGFSCKFVIYQKCTAAQLAEFDKTKCGVVCCPPGTNLAPFGGTAIAGFANAAELQQYLDAHKRPHIASWLCTSQIIMRPYITTFIDDVVELLKHRLIMVEKEVYTVWPKELIQNAYHWLPNTITSYYAQYCVLREILVVDQVSRPEFKIPRLISNVKDDVLAAQRHQRRYKVRVNPYNTPFVLPLVQLRHDRHGHISAEDAVGICNLVNELIISRRPLQILANSEYRVIAVELIVQRRHLHVQTIAALISGIDPIVLKKGFIGNSLIKFLLA